MRRPTRIVTLGVLALSLPSAAHAQTLASRIGTVRDGTVRMSFDSRPGVCGDGEGNVWVIDARGSQFADSRHPCIPGPVLVSIGRAGGQTVSVRSRVGGLDTPAGDLDLGHVPAYDAARYLLELARTLGGRSSNQALSAAAFADAPNVWPEFARLVRDRDAMLESRKDALFWLGQSDAPTTELVRLYDELEPEPLRDHATFVLSQRHDDAAVDKLIDIARHDRDLDVRKRAMFWLGQSRDPRAVKFFRDVLVR